MPVFKVIKPSTMQLIGISLFGYILLDWPKPFKDASQHLIIITSIYTKQSIFSHLFEIFHEHQGIKLAMAESGLWDPSWARSEPNSGSRVRGSGSAGVNTAISNPCC